jgi:hypothetical protein
MKRINIKIGLQFLQELTLELPSGSALLRVGAFGGAGGGTDML